MSLVLNIYSAKDSKTTAKDLQAFLNVQPHFRPEQNGEYVYENENTGVYFVVGNEPVERPASGLRSLEKAFIVNYGRAEFFVLEAFPVIADICNKLGLLVDNEQEGKPRKVNAAQLHKEWLHTNDSFLREMAQKHDSEETGAAYMPRKASNELWRFLVGKEALQDKMVAEEKDVYVAQPLFFRDREYKVVTAVAWPAAIPIVIPPHTDFLLLMTDTQKRLFRATGPKPIGYVTMSHLLELAGGSFVRHKDGSLELSQAEADRIRGKVMAMQPDIGANQSPGKPLSQDHVIDVKA